MVIRLQPYAVQQLIAIPFFVILIVMALIPSTILAATSLSLHLSSTEVEHGLYLKAELHGLNLGSDLSQIDLSPLTPLFGVHVVETTTETEGELSPNTWQRMLLRLYPRQTGKLSIPSLRMGDLATTIHSVTVKPAFSKNMPITISLRQSTNKAWQRQQVVIEAELKTAQRFVTLESDDFSQPSLDALTLPITQEELQEGQSQSSIYHIQWIIYPQASGNFALELPPLQYASGGLVEREFHLPIIYINVKSLPPYIPPTIPVGKVSLKTQIPNAFLFATDKTATWEILLHSTELIPQSLPPVLRQIHSTENVHFHTAASKRTQQADAKGPHGQVLHRIPFTPNKTGIFILPSLRIQYFDPTNGRLITVKSTALNAYAISPLWIFILGTIFIVSLIVVIRRLANAFTHYRGRLMKHRYAIQLASASSNPLELRVSLRHYALAFGWSENLCLRDWLENWSHTFTINEKIPRLLQLLSVACYGQQQEIDFENLRSELVLTLTQTHPSFLFSLRSNHVDT